MISILENIEILFIIMIILGLVAWLLRCLEERSNSDN